MTGSTKAAAATNTKAAATEPATRSRQAGEPRNTESARRPTTPVGAVSSSSGSSGSRAIGSR